MARPESNLSLATTYKDAYSDEGLEKTPLYHKKVVRFMYKEALGAPKIPTLYKIMSLKIEEKKNSFGWFFGIFQSN